MLGIIHYHVSLVVIFQVLKVFAKTLRRDLIAARVGEDLLLLTMPKKKRGPFRVCPGLPWATVRKLMLILKMSGIYWTR